MRNIAKDIKLSVKDDVVFKELFSRIGNEIFLKEFLSSLLNEKIEDLIINHDIYLEIKNKKDKIGVLDLNAVANGVRLINLEMQNENKGNTISRSKFYGSKIYTNQLKRGQSYSLLKKTTVIFILDYILFSDTKEWINKTVTVLDNHRDKIIDDCIEYYYIELPKFRKAKIDTDNKLHQWLVFIDGENEEELKVIMAKNSNVKRAQEELEYLQGDEALKRKLYLREKYEHDFASAVENAEIQGEAKGKVEGKVEGKEENKVQIAKKLLSRGMSVEEIANITELSVEKIEKLKEVK